MEQQSPEDLKSKSKKNSKLDALKKQKVGWGDQSPEKRPNVRPEDEKLPQTEEPPTESDASGEVEEKTDTAASQPFAGEFQQLLKKDGKKESTSTVHIRQSSYNKLKMVATYTNSNINSIVANLIDDFINNHHKEIKKAKKDYEKEVGF